MDKKILEQCLNQKLNITIFQELDSTNNYLKKLGLQGEKETQLVIAESQTGGRGRMGRAFYSPNGTGIYFSLLLHPKFSAEKSLFLTVMAAVSVAETVMKYNKNDVKIKWVNDIYIDGKKVCGILTEGAINSNKMLDYAVVGIGINIIAPENGFPDEIKGIATAIFPGNAEKNIKEKIVADVVNKFFGMYNGEDNNYIKRYKEYSYLTGKEINIISGENIRPATVIDITDDCHLLVKNENGEVEEISSGDVSVRIK
ncbi:MAG: biotin--[acetyl-CoA-carboxylase] ligase [Clostridia bacterium]|nr:biotin--[acetyl-CoA-carboxylase] ligase [Clostridia bacterium]